jgi:hypothetical protein
MASPSPGVMTPSASAAVTAFIAGAISAGLSIDGRTRLTARSRHGGKIPSRQSRIAVGSPASAQLDSPAGQGLGLALKAVPRRRSSRGCGSPADDPLGRRIGRARTAGRAAAPAVLAKIDHASSTLFALMGDPVGTPLRCKGM